MPAEDSPNPQAPPTGNGDRQPVMIVVCTTCRRPGDAEDAKRAGARLANAVAAAAATRVVLRPVQCLANCSRGPSAALCRPGAWTYVFGWLDPTEGAAALLEGARLLAASPDGLLPWAGRPEALKRGMIARIPPLEVTPLEVTPLETTS